MAELTLNIGISCVKKMRALKRLRQMTDEEVETFLVDGIEGVLSAVIFEELGMDLDDLTFGKIASASSDAAPRVAAPSNKQEEAQAETYGENQHTLSSEVDEDTEPKAEEPEQTDFSFVEQNIQNALSASSMSDDDLADQAMDVGDPDDEDEPVVAQKARKARSKFDKPAVRVSDATYSS